eukprot:6457884-Amphidinium_carterae.2
MLDWGFASTRMVKCMLLHPSRRLAMLTHQAVSDKQHHALPSASLSAAFHNGVQFDAKDVQHSAQVD